MQKDALNNVRITDEQVIRTLFSASFCMMAILSFLVCDS